MNFTRTNEERGVILITASIVVLTLTALGSAFLLTSLGNNRYSQFKSQESRAAMIAEAGAEMAMFELSYGNRLTFPGRWGDMDDLANNPPILFGGGAIEIETALLGTSTSMGVITVTATYPWDPNNPNPARTRPQTKVLDITVYNDTNTTHTLYYKAIYAGNHSGIDYHLEFGGVGNQADTVSGDIHVEGSIDFGGDTDPANFDSLSATGNINTLDYLGEVNGSGSGGGADSITPPDLASNGYDLANRQYKSWDSSTHGNDVVHVHDEFSHYQTTNGLQDIAISAEGGWFNPGGYSEWNSQAKALPDSNPANFFHEGYQNHFADTYTASDDTRISNTKNFYLGQRNNGTPGSFGDSGPYGGGHSVITVTPEMNNKVYYIEGNLWIDSDGSNHIFFKPGSGVDKVNISIVVKGNIYIGDQIFTTTTSSNPEQASKTIGWRDSTWNGLGDDSGLALIAMRDGESFNDVNKNGKYDPGETIIGRADPSTPAPSQNNPSPSGTYSTGYEGRMEGSGNIIFGDTISGPVGVVEAFMFAENNFADITADTSQGDQNPYIFGNMTAGNNIMLNRNTGGWQEVDEVSTIPNDWVQINGDWYPAGTTSSNYDNPFVTYRKAEQIPAGYGSWGSSGNWTTSGPGSGWSWVQENGQWYAYQNGQNGSNATNRVYATWYNGRWWYRPYSRSYSSSGGYKIYNSNHNPLDLGYDSRMEDGVIDMPGLPSSTDTTYGTWKPIIWRMR